MDLSTISMAKDQAEAAFKEYRGAFLAERNRIDGELMRGYKALKEGKQLIRLTETIAAGGEDSLGRPRLAISRADEREMQMVTWRSGMVQYEPAMGGVRARDRVFRLPDGTLPKDENREWKYWFALVPIVPPRFRPPNSALTNFHVLWEAEWYASAKTRRAPRDPALLRHLGGDLWVVLATWDLTELERAVLEMRPQ
jgi:hypothetical protein